MTKIFIAGFGGQGILFTGKFIAYAGMIENRQVTWLPSYGAESRGGTSNCHVIVSDTAIGSPVVLEPDVLICMNLPSLDKFEETLTPGGHLFVNSSLVTKKTARTDVEAFYIPATELAIQNELEGLANMIILGSVMQKNDICKKETIEKAMRGVVSERRKDLIEKNIKAIDIGMKHS